MNESMKLTPREPAPALPQWVADLVGRLPAPGEAAIDIVQRAGLATVRAVVPGARRLARPELRREVGRLYDSIRETLEAAGAPHPLRFWNLIPGIHDDMGDGLVRYMVFNAGRHDALCRWFHGPEAFPELMPAATGVGYDGDDLQVYCLAGSFAGRAVENPRQRPVYHYSERYGPLPPCFARAMVAVLDGRPWLLLAGTASIRGEESVHVGSLTDQIDETVLNLTSLVESVEPETAGAWVFRELRCYHPRVEDAEPIRANLQARFPGLERLETLRADLCRDDLLVEIEGVAV